MVTAWRLNKLTQNSLNLLLMLRKGRVGNKQLLLTVSKKLNRSFLQFDDRFELFFFHSFHNLSLFRIWNFRRLQKNFILGYVVSMIKTQLLATLWEYFFKILSSSVEDFFLSFQDFVREDLQRWLLPMPRWKKLRRWSKHYIRHHLVIIESMVIGH